MQSKIRLFVGKRKLNDYSTVFMGMGAFGLPWGSPPARLFVKKSRDNPSSKTFCQRIISQSSL